MEGGYRVARVGSYVTEQGEAGGGHGGVPGSKSGLVRNRAR